MVDEGGKVAETRDGGENDDKMDVWSEIEGLIQEREIEERLDIEDVADVIRKSRQKNGVMDGVYRF